MFTVCPKCTLTLVVTTVDLRAGQGYVRCGRCANVFNALIALREGDPSGSTSDSARRRLLETSPLSPVNPALGSGVAVEPEPAPAPAPAPAPEPEPEPEPEPAPEFFAAAEEEPAADADLDLNFDSPAPDPGEGLPEEASLEFDDTSTDVTEIFVSPSQEEHDTGSGSYEAVVLAVEPPPESEPEPDPEPDFVSAAEAEAVLESQLEATGDLDDPSHTETIAADDWSLLDDDDDVPADAESVIEESPFAMAPEPEPEPEPESEATMETVSGDPAWVEEMFAEAEAEVIRSRTAEHRFLESTEIGEVGQEEPAVVQAARDIKGVSAPSGDTVLGPLLPEPAKQRPAWVYVSGVALLALTLILQFVHHKRQSLVLNASVGPAISTVYGWFDVTLSPRWDLTAYSVTQRGVDAEGAEGSRLRVRLSVHNDSDRVQPLPLVRLTLKDRYANPVATRDLEPEEYLPAQVASQRLLEPDQRIDAELHVIDPGKAAVGFEIDACLRSEDGVVGCANDVRQRTPATTG